MNKLASTEDLLKAVSLFEFYLQLMLLLAIVSMHNLYLAVLLLGLISKHIPERIIKSFLSKRNGQLIDLAKRPEGAENCNMFNSGGSVIHSGLISGHVFLLSTLIFYALFRFTNGLKNGLTHKQETLITLLVIWCGLVSYARINLKCHQPEQVAIGLFLGVGWGYLVYFVIEKIKTHSRRIRNDELKILNLFQ